MNYKRLIICTNLIKKELIQKQLNNAINTMCLLYWAPGRHSVEQFEKLNEIIKWFDENYPRIGTKLTDLKKNINRFSSCKLLLTYHYNFEKNTKRWAYSSLTLFDFIQECEISLYQLTIQIY